MTTILVAGSVLAPDRAVAQAWTLETSLAVRAVLDDNVYLTEENSRTDLTTFAVPGLRIAREGERVDFAANYDAKIELYAQRPEQHSPTHTGQVTLVLRGIGPQFLQSTTLQFSDALTVTDRLVDVDTEGAPGNDGIATEPNRSWQNLASAQVSRPLTNRLGTIMRYTHRVTRYENPEFVDLTVQYGTVRLPYQLMDRVVVSPGYGLRHQRSDQSTRYNHEAGLIVTVTINPTLTANAMGGVAYFPDTDSAYPVAGASLTKEFEYTHASVSYERRIGAGGGVFTEPTVTQIVIVVLKRPLGPRAGVNLSSTYAQNRATGADNSVTTSISGRAGLTVVLARWLRASAAFAHLSQRMTDTETIEVQRNTLTLTLTGFWGTPLQ